MERPGTDLWEKSYKEDMRKWIRWHVENTKIDDGREFMIWFMKMSKGRVNPQVVQEVWNESK